MRREELGDRVSLDHLTDEQLAILERDAIGWLLTKADDLPAFRDDEAWRGEVEEVAALARLVSGLRSGQILPDDEVARKMAARTVSETRTLDELRREYRREHDEHDAWAALLACFERKVPQVR